MFYDTSLPTRRTLLVSGIVAFATTTFLGSGARALGISIAEAAEDPPLIGADGPFQRSTVVEIARQLAKAAYAPPPSDLPDPIKNLTYDELRDIRFKPAAAVWANTSLPFQLELFHRGFYYKDKLDVAIVDDSQAHHLAYSPDMFTTGKVFTKPLPKEDIGFAGIRLHGRINAPDRFDEVAVFQGASYFRSLGKDQLYGLSARGLALKVAEPEGEEFPLFRAFWVETPVADSDAVVVHALLDSPSVAGAYRFTIRPGLPTTMDVEATLFPRVELTKVGLAPGTTMFYFSLNGRDGVDDWRPEVHDLDGLLMVNGRGERLWRPLSNPHRLQISAFQDTGPRGFGLIQRDRHAETYQDFESHYELRPSLWVEPVGDWGQGSVTLVEIPSDSEINDNIVAYWAPKEPIPAGSEFSFAYRLSWGNDPAQTPGGAVVAATRRGKATLKGDSPVRRFVIDYMIPDQGAERPKTMPKADIWASAGTLSDVVVEDNPIDGGWRVVFKLDPGTNELIELRCVLSFDDKRPAEIWTYRWTA